MVGVAHELCTGIDAARRFHYDVQGAGHYGIFSGRRWREMVYPRLREFVVQFDRPAAPAATGVHVVPAAAPSTNGRARRA